MKLRVLVVEDTEEDALLLLRELRRVYDVHHRQVWTPEAMRDALADEWDLVISDWSMPRFDGLAAFRIVRELELDLPFVIVSGTIGEEVAVEALKAGVHDFMPKGKFARLLPTIERELREAEVRRRRREADAEVSRQRDLVAGSEARHRAMFEHSPLPMWIFDRETLRFLAVNEAAVRHYGYSREEFEAMTISDIRPPEAHAALHAVLGRSGLVDAGVWQHRRRDGSIIDVEIRANDLLADGRSVRLVLVNDVTERERTQQALRATEEQLRQAQKMEAIGQLAGSVAHDFNNVLTVIESYAAMLEESLDAADGRREDAIEIRRATTRATAITRQLLALSRHSIVAPRSLDVGELVTGFSTMLRRLLGERVGLVTHLGEVPPVVADPGSLEQVLMNLAVNARDAMPGGGRLTIETQTTDLDEEGAAARGVVPGRFVVVAVSDTGRGMDAETQRRIFEPFFTTKELGKGTGLGLAIVHGIVSQAGGAIAVYSEVGHGTTFRILLPVTSETVVAPAVARVAAPRVLPDKTVLIIDDEHALRTVAARILQEAGCRVVEAATAEEARRICVSHDGVIDLALLDVVLPDHRGDLLLSELLELRPTMRGILMSGYPAGALTPSGGVPRDLLAKPFSPSDLREAVARALGLDGEEGVVEAPAAREPSANPRVLVADDDGPFRRAIARILQRTECEVVEVDNGRAALLALEERPFDVILSDVHMPEGGGLDLLRAVRRVDLDVPVILMSGAPEVASAATAVEYGAFRYLTKPVESAVLSKLVRHAARAHALARLRREAFAVTGAFAGAADRAGLEVRFEQAMDLLWLAFQPIYRAADGGLFGVEALMRSKEVSLPGPQAVLDAATQLGRLAQVGRRVRALCAEAFAGRTDDCALFVNLHPEDLDDIELVAATSPLTSLASRVVLEVTERASLLGSPDLTARLARLRGLGFRLAVDDIGAGYSGLTSFTELMPEIVKIDMSLVRNVHLSAVKQRTIAALCRLCHEVDCLVVAEGVETIEERDCVVELGCDLLQGYLLGRPKAELPPG